MIQDTSIVRAFLAVYPDGAARSSIAEFVEDCRRENESVKWEKAPQVHITMKFLGDVTVGALRAIEANLHVRLAEQPAIEARADHTGVFPNFRDPSIVWIGFSRDVPALQALHRIVEDVCFDAGCSRERKPFTPHFTVGRVKKYSNTRNLQNELEACSLSGFPVLFDAVRIVESSLTPSGAVHTERARIPFLRS